MGTSDGPDGAGDALLATAAHAGQGAHSAVARGLPQAINDAAPRHSARARRATGHSNFPLTDEERELVVRLAEARVEHPHAAPEHLVGEVLVEEESRRTRPS